MSLTLLYSTFPSQQSAEAAARHLLEEKLVACTVLLPAATSLYWWEGAIETAQEVILLCKTPAPLADSAATRLEALHPYDCPAILRLPAEANAAYLSWAKAATTAS